ncbi:MAG: DNA primase [Planctomycetes bacterium]|nr:DNA primase [Planctomycetota bacterium]
MPQIPPAKVDEVRAATDIVDVISRYLPLKRSGANFVAVCPFHPDKSPSLTVWPATQTFRCFGCGKGGDVFHFLMERERLSFPEALRSLARDAGIEVGGAGGEREDREGRERLYGLLEWACRFFETHLRSPVGAKAIQYLKNRKITGESAKAFRLGCSPNAWGALRDAAHQEGYSDDHLSRAGLIRTGQKEPYDWFRDRLMFPIQDVRGRVVGFGGRTFGDDEPKYLNSPDTELFKKGSMLYGLHLARDEAVRLHRLGIVEGYTDAIMAHQHGVKWIVAGLGTGLTRDHAVLVRRYAERVDLVYDGDAAGVKAAERAVDAFLEVEADIRVVSLPDELDPCDFLVERGPERFAEMLGQGTEVFDFLLARAVVRNDVSTTHGRTAAVDFVLSSVAKVANPVKRDILLHRTAEGLSVGEAAVRSRLRAVTPRGGVIRTDSEPPAAAVEEDPLSERLLLQAVLFEPALAGRLAEEWPPERFRGGGTRALAGALLSLGARREDWSAAELAGLLPEPAHGALLAALLAEGEGKADFGKQFTDCLEGLTREVRVREAKERIRLAIERGDAEERREWERELFRLQRRAR